MLLTSPRISVPLVEKVSVDMLIANVLGYPPLKLPEPSNDKPYIVDVVVDGAYRTVESTVCVDRASSC